MDCGLGAVAWALGAGWPQTPVHEEAQGADRRGGVTLGWTSQLGCSSPFHLLELTISLGV